MNRLERLTAILTQLQSKRTVTAQEIADRFGISLRTVYRDIKALHEGGVPITGEAGVGYGVIEGYRLPPVTFSQEEALSLLLAEKIFEKTIGTSNPMHFNNAMTKIRAILKTPEKESFENLAPKIAFLRQTTDLEAPIYETKIQQIILCLSAKKLMEINYTSFEKEERTMRKVEPIGIYNAFERWYLIAWCRLRKDYRTFRLDRISQIKIMEERIEGVHPSLQEYLEKIRKTEKLTQIVIEIPAKYYKYIQTQKYNHGYVMEEKIGKNYRLTFMSSSLEYFIRWIIMMGDCIRILSPVEGKERLKELAKAVLSKINTDDD
jgi:predicted DNA-binding transcriptional regulator YafY